MYFVYKNNMQMYLTKNEMVIKTWDKIYKFVADKQMFDSIQTLAGYVGTPRTYAEIEKYFSDKKEFNVHKTMAILLKTKVVMMQENPNKLQNPLIYRYENGEEILKRMEKKEIQAVNVNDRIRERIQKAGMRIGAERDGDYLLIWNDEGVEKLESLFGEYHARRKKMILTGIHKGYIYSLSCDTTCNDIRKACYYIRKNKEEAEITNYQIRIMEKILENQCLEYFFVGKKQYNFTLITPDLSVRNEWINYHMSIGKGEKTPIEYEHSSQKQEGLDYLEIGRYMNRLPYVGYFGSKDCNQMPLPEQTAWLLSRNGEIACKVFAKGDTCESAMANCIRSILINMNGEEDAIVSVSDNKEDYYFAGIAELLFQADGENTKKVGEVQHLGMKAVCFKHTLLPVYRGKLWYQRNSKSIYGRTEKELRKKIRCGLIELGGAVEESIELAAELVRLSGMEKMSVVEGDINEDCLKYLKEIGYVVYEKEFANIRELKEKGLYAGEFLIGGSYMDGNAI